MPYMTVVTQMMEDGPRGLVYAPTIVGDSHSDSMVMGQLHATVTKVHGFNIFQFTVDEVPRVTLDKLETMGWKVVAMTGTYPDLTFLLHKPAQ